MFRHVSILLTLTLGGLFYFLSFQTLANAAPVNAHAQRTQPFKATKAALSSCTSSNATNPSCRSSSSSTMFSRPNPNIASCPAHARKIEKAKKVLARRPQNPPQTREIEIGSVKRTINRLPANEQGLNSFVYQVEGGWPLEGTSTVVPSLAKTGRDDTDDLDEEAKTLDRVGLLVRSGIALPDAGSGVQDCTFWIIMKDVSVDKSLLGDILSKKNTQEECTQALTTAVDLTVAVTKNFVETKGILHTDSHPGNVLFDDALREAELIDWRDAVDTTTFDEERTKQLVNIFFQTEFESVCGKKSKIVHDLML